MRIIFKALIFLMILPGVACAHGMSAHRASTAGAAPQVWDHEPGPNDQVQRFQVIYVDDRTCPSGQIKKFTAGSRQFGVKPTRECVDH